MGKEIVDNYEEACKKIWSAYILACNGYYEPKSERDLRLSIKLHEFLKQNLEVERVANGNNSKNNEVQADAGSA
jgi:hypothetical protein